LHIYKYFFEPLAEFRLWLPPTLIALVLIIIARFDFLTFHTLAELFAVLIAFSMFAFVWATRQFRKDGFLIVLACGYFWIGSLDLVHLLVFEGMGLFIEGDTNLSVQLWIATRFLEAFVLLIAPIIAIKSRSEYFLFALFGIVSIGLVASIFSGHFPTVFVEGKGLTDFKVYSEYLIVLILGFAFFVLNRRQSNISSNEKSLISASIVLTICAELALTLYVNVDEIPMVVGHIFKLFSYWLIFQATVIYSLKIPFSELRDLQVYNRSLFENSVTGMTLCEMDGTFVDVNPAFANITGYSVDELLSGMTYWELTPESFYQTETSIMEEFALTGSLGPFQKDYLRKDGSVVPVRVLGNLIVHHGKKYNLASVEDISEQINAEAERLELEFQKMALDEHAIVSITNVKGDITYVNDKFCEISGYSRNELLGQNHRILQSNEHSAEYYKDLWRTIANGTPWHGILRNIRRDGGYYWAEATIVPFLNKEGKPIKYVCIRTDITKQKAAEDAKRRFETTIDLTQDEIFIASIYTLEIFFANRAASELVGYSVEELRKMTPVDFIPNLTLTQLREKVRPLLDRVAKSVVFRTLQEHKNGTLTPVEIRLQCISPYGEEPHLLFVLRDITEIKEAELQIAQFRSTLDSIQDPVYMFWPDTLEYFYVNQAAVDFSGISAEQYLGHTPLEIFAGFETQEFHTRYEGLYSGKLKSQTYETHHMNYRGERVPVEVLAQMIQTKGKKAHIVEITRDISERKEIDKAKSEFISTVSHELRTPLTSIKGSLGLIKAGLFGELSDKLASLIDIAHTNSERLTLLIDDILTVEKLDAGMTKLNIKQINLNWLIEESLEANAGYGEQYGVTIVCSHENLSLEVNVDRDRIMQVMANLISNAVKFSARGGQVTVVGSRHKGCIRISVKDNGAGIPKEAWPTIFDRFTQADSSDQRAKGGTGLGLNITKTIVEGHGGTVSFISEMGKGTTFYVDLPEVKAE